MSTTRELNDTRVNYFGIAQAQRMSGLRLVLSNYAIPGPWREACKSVLQIKGRPYTPYVAKSGLRSPSSACP